MAGTVTKPRLLKFSPIIAHANERHRADGSRGRCLPALRGEDRTPAETRGGIRSNTWETLKKKKKEKIINK